MVDIILLFNFIMFMANKLIQTIGDTIAAVKANDLIKTLGDTNAAVYLEPTRTRLSED